MNILQKQNKTETIHTPTHPPPRLSYSPSTPTSYFYDALLPNKLLWCLESIRSNIPLLKTSWLILGEWSKETGSRGRGGPQISISIEGRLRGDLSRESRAAGPLSVQSDSKEKECHRRGSWGGTYCQQEMFFGKELFCIEFFSKPTLFCFVFFA